MKKIAILTLVFILMTTMLSGCGTSNAENSTLETNQTNKTTKTNQMATQQSNSPVSEDANRDFSQEKMLAHKQLAKDDLVRKFYSDEKNIVLEEFGDFDHDGKVNAVIGVKGSNSDNINPVDVIVYLTFDGVSEPSVVTVILCYDKSKVLEFGLINVNGISDKLLYISEQYAAQSRGFDLYKLTSDGFEDYIHAAPYYDVGFIDLFDDDNDGIYDGYEISKFGYDSYYYYIIEKILFKEDDSTAIDSVTLLDEGQKMPTNPKDVALVYAYLSNIKSNLRNSSGDILQVKGLDEKLQELSKDGFVDDYKYIWDSNLLQNTAIGIKPRIEFDVQQQGDKAIAHAVIIGDLASREDIVQESVIDYIMKQINGKWVIDDIEPEPYYSNEDSFLNENVSGDNTSIYLSRVFSDKQYTVESDDVVDDMGILYENILYQDDTKVVSNISPFMEYDIDTSNLEKLPEGRVPNWLFVEFIGDNYAKKPIGDLYFINKLGFDEFMRTGLIEDKHLKNGKAVLMASTAVDKNAEYIKHKMDSPLYDVSTEMYGDGDKYRTKITYYLDQADNRKEEFMKSYLDWCDKNPEYAQPEGGVYREVFTWEKGIGLVGYNSWFENEKYMDIIAPVILEINEGR